MKFIALLGSLMFIVWLVGVLTLSFHNLSKGFFGLDNYVKPYHRLVRFWMREFVILLWPLVLASAEGRHALRVIWTGKDDI